MRNDGGGNYFSSLPNSIATMTIKNSSEIFGEVDPSLSFKL
jgi:hypothetical protein